MKQPLQVLQRQTTSTEFLEWCAYFDMHMNDIAPEHYYLAQLTAEVRRSWIAKGQDKVKTKEFLIKFVPKKRKVKKRSPQDIEAERKKRLEASKSAWLGALGIPKEKWKKET